MSKIQELIERHGYNLKLEVGNGLTKTEATNIIKNAVNEALTLPVVKKSLPLIEGKTKSNIKEHKTGRQAPPPPPAVRTIKGNVS